jgi:hypothetical protein
MPTHEVQAHLLDMTRRVIADSQDLVNESQQSIVDMRILVKESQRLMAQSAAVRNPLVWQPQN